MVNLLKEMHMKTRNDLFFYLSDWQKLKVNNSVFTSLWESRSFYINIAGRNVNGHNLFVRPVW